MIRALLLDADGVLQSSPRFAEVAAAAVPHAQRDAFTQALWDAEDPCLSGAASFETELRKTLVAWNIEPAYAAMMQAFHDIDPDAGMLARVARLRRAGIVCCIASNQQPSRAQHMSGSLGYARSFDHEFYSHAIGFAKPHAGYFRHIQRVLALPPAELLFIDDRMANVQAAAATGITAEHFPANVGGGYLDAVLRRHGLPSA